MKGKINRTNDLSLFHSLQTKKVKVIAVGVGSGIDNLELLQIASNQRKNVIHVKNFDYLPSKLNDILRASCPVLH